MFHHRGQIFRGLTVDALRDWEALAATRFFKDYTAAGRVIATERWTGASPPGAGEWAAWLRHQRVPVVTYPYEWSFSMLKDAALLQLDLLLAALDEGLTLKDSTPFNVQWIGTRPVFIDTASFTRAEPGVPWLGYRQFCEMFLYPLLLQAYKEVPFQPWLRGNPEGLDPADVNRVMSLRDRLRAGVLTHVYLLSKAQSRYGETRRDVRSELRSAGFGSELVKANVRRMRRLVERLQWRPARSEWSDYADANSYDAESRARKLRFVIDAARARRRCIVWDLGCNTGEYSRAVSDSADTVVSLDADHLAIERLYRALRQDSNATILPLVGDLMNPSPALGWRNVERPTLQERAQPDLILALALVHHLAVARNVPLPELAAWLASFGAEVIVEFVGPADPMVQRLLRNRGNLDFGYTQPRFETELGRYFMTVASEPLLSGSRTIYHLRPRPRA